MTLVTSVDGTRERKELKGNSVSISQEDVETDDQLKLMMQRMRSKYEEIRGRLSAED